MRFFSRKMIFKITALSLLIQPYALINGGCTKQFKKSLNSWTTILSGLEMIINHPSLPSFTALLLGVFKELKRGMKSLLSLNLFCIRWVQIIWGYGNKSCSSRTYAYYSTQTILVSLWKRIKPSRICWWKYSQPFRKNRKLQIQ